MEQYTITGIFVYPIKSLSAIALNKAVLTDTGVRYDRRWMLVDEKGDAITQREMPQMALFRLEMNEDRIEIKHPHATSYITVSGKKKEDTDTKKRRVKIWGEEVEAIIESEEVNNWFSELLAVVCQLVYLPEEITRSVKENEESKIHLADDAQYLLTGESSLEYLNMIATDHIEMNRFRPNIVFKGGKAFEEDQWHRFSIGDSKFEITKSCSRCRITAVDQKTGEMGREPILTLTRYRKENGKLYFGRYLKLYESKSNLIEVGQKINVLELESYT